MKASRTIAALRPTLEMALTCLALLGCGKAPPSSTATPGEEPLADLGPVAIIEPPTSLDPVRVALGESLFMDTRISGNGTVSCSTCHDLARGGVDGFARSVGVAGQPLALNTPTVFNSALNFRQFWDGRAVTLEAQLDGPLLSPREMGSSWNAALSALRADRELSNRFSSSYAEGLSESTIRDALATFERSLATTDAPLDRYLTGDKTALSSLAQHGYELFTSYGCSACHQGRGVGGNMFQKLGVMEDYFVGREPKTSADMGRYNVTHDEADRHVFKVPSLRNVARTAPYLHDGSIATLSETIRIMVRYQVGRDIQDDEVSALQAFLESLTGSYRGRSL